MFLTHIHTQLGILLIIVTLESRISEDPSWCIFPRLLKQEERIYRMAYQFLKPPFKSEIHHFSWPKQVIRPCLPSKKAEKWNATGNGSESEHTQISIPMCFLSEMTPYNLLRIFNPSIQINGRVFYLIIIGLFFSYRQ